MQVFARLFGGLVAASLLLIGTAGNAKGDTGVVSGRVVDADGKGVERIEVGLYRTSADQV